MNYKTFSILALISIAIPVYGQSGKSTYTFVRFNSESNMSLFQQTKEIPLTLAFTNEKTFESDELMKGIPITKKINKNRFALIVGNENYRDKNLGLDDVAFAINDAKAFREYAVKSFGILKENIFYLENASSGILAANIERLVLLLGSSAENKELIYYFSGHGIVSGKNNQFYTLPVDVEPVTLAGASSINSVFEKFSEMGNVLLVAFTDACSGGRNRVGATLISQRGIKLEPGEGALPPRSILFTAASLEQVASSYQDKNHGLFTYLLLKNIKEFRSGNSWSELSESVIKVTKDMSIRLMYKEQTPSIKGHPASLDSWKKLKVIE